MAGHACWRPIRAHLEGPLGEVRGLSLVFISGPARCFRSFMLVTFQACLRGALHMRQCWPGGGGGRGGAFAAYA